LESEGKSGKADEEPAGATVKTAVKQHPAAATLQKHFFGEATAVMRGQLRSDRCGKESVNLRQNMSTQSSS
jgi:hypothetical protein